MINILYDGKVIHKQVSEEESLVILVELAEKAYKGEIDEDKVDFNYVQEKKPWQQRQRVQATFNLDQRSLDRAMESIQNMLLLAQIRPESVIAGKVDIKK